MAQKKSPEVVKDLHPAPYNPRTMSAKEHDGLAASMQQFGDLGGIVFNRRTSRLIGAHQRKQHLPDDAQVMIYERWKKPNKQGTVAIGYIEQPDGERWSYREVDVSQDIEKAMNIAANRHTGHWDMELLPDLIADLTELSLPIGFSDDEIAEMLFDPDSIKPASIEDQGKLGQISAKEHTCPECGHEFTA